VEVTVRDDISGVRLQVEIRSQLLPGQLQQVARVRVFVSEFLRGAPGSGEVQQVVSELAANAARHTRSGDPGGWFVVELCRWRHLLWVSVTDQGGANGPPSRFDQDQLVEHGRGLLLVAQLSTWSGWYGDAAGRTFVALFLIEEDQSSGPGVGLFSGYGWSSTG
jgi:serine/threonine-protein kinase RsbW